MKIVIAPDSFKESLSALEVADAIAEGWQKVIPDTECICIPMADGGEGTVQSLIDATHGRWLSVDVTAPLGNTVRAEFGISGDGKTAIIEMAAASGLHLVPIEKRNPLITTSYGTGELIKAALDQGVAKIILGIGGSATNDAGAGMLQALGAVFWDQDGVALGFGGGALINTAHVDFSKLDPRLQQVELDVACDVNNPLCGEKGASAIFGPQKGASPEMVATLDKALHHFATVIQQQHGLDIRHHAGAGAAGGMGGGLHAFLDAQLKPGIELLLETLDFAEKIKDADLLITGEGKSDRQTLMGKVPSGILQEARRQHIPVILLAGAIEDAGILNAAGFRGVFSITPSPVSLEQAMQPEFAQENIRRTVEQICRIFF